ncbi:MAG TPA: hypothetical protein VGG99_11810 [Acetobacteraceae bacterium]|jgi:hypothetical protein
MMQTSLPLSDIGRSDKAIVITSIKNDFVLVPSGPGVDPAEGEYIDEDIRARGVSRAADRFEVSGAVSTYLIEPGTYVLSFVGDWAAKETINADELHSPVRFHVSAGDVVYLGDLHFTTDYSGCGGSIVFTVRDSLGADGAAIDKILDDRYPGARDRLKTSLLRVPAGTLLMKRTGVICFEKH